ncbi:DUF58 domain-containing protein [Haloferula sp.]|uniref:DUF58 domain-containing protein n=1 Tax=Haloferula sp. TaxID=2497595 RepID=UPI003C770DA8
MESRLRLLELKCRRPVEHLLVGEYRSVFRGQGVEFEDVRPYQPGDDVRTMDWKVTARTGTPHIKRYIEEREQFIYLLVDVSASMLEGAGGRKRATMAELGSLITMAAVGNGDRVGLVLFTDQIELLIPPGKGRQHGLRIMEALVGFKPVGRQTAFSDVFARFGHLARKRSVAFVISDFLAGDYLEEMSSLALRHDLNAVNLLEVDGLESVDEELVRLEDAESGEVRFVDLGRKKASEDRHHETLQEQMMERGVSLMEVGVGEDCVSALAGFFRSRQRRLADETGG